MILLAKKVEFPMKIWYNLKINLVHREKKGLNFMQSINLRPMILGEAVVNQREQKIIITSQQKLNYPELMLAVMGVRNSVDDQLIGYEIYENGEHVAKVKG